MNRRDTNKIIAATAMSTLLSMAAKGQAGQVSSRPPVRIGFCTDLAGPYQSVELTREGLSWWFFVTADYAFGRELQAHGTEAVRAAGGTVVGSVRNPHDANDFKPYLKAASDSHADVLGLANGHAELLKAMAAMDDMGLTHSMKLVGLLTFADLHRRHPCDGPAEGSGPVLGGQQGPAYPE